MHIHIEKRGINSRNAHQELWSFFRVILRYVYGQKWRNCSCKSSSSQTRIEFPRGLAICLMGMKRNERGKRNKSTSINCVNVSFFFILFFIFFFKQESTLYRTCSCILFSGKARWQIKKQGWWDKKKWKRKSKAEEV